MLKKEVNKQNVIDALKFIDRNGIPKNRHSTKYNLYHDGKSYPPKYVLSVATRISTGNELEPSMFSGGKETNDFLMLLGFLIRDGNNELKKKQNKSITICSSLIQSSNNFEEWNNQRLKQKIDLLEIILQNLKKGADLLILPAGFFNCKTAAYSKVLSTIENKVSALINLYHSSLTICSGIDGSNRTEHMGIAIKKSGIIAIARKFHNPDNSVKLAIGAFDHEKQMDRSFEIKGKKAYIAVCYDTFGISHRKLDNEGDFNFVISLVHIFNKSGPGASATDFARKGLAGAAKQWNLNIYASAVFAENRNAENWPAGVKWVHGNTSVTEYKFDDIRIKAKIDKVYTDDSIIYLNYFTQ